MDQQCKQELELIAQRLRITGLKMVEGAHSGHIGGAFSLSEIMAVLYFDKMNIRPEQPDWEDRDRFVLSKGHCTVALYPALALRGFMPLERLGEFRKIDGHLSGHADMTHVPGVDMSTGSLGQGLSTAVGMAQCAKMLGKRCDISARRIRKLSDAPRWGASWPGKASIVKGDGHVLVEDALYPAYAASFALKKACCFSIV